MWKGGYALLCLLLILTTNKKIFLNSPSVDDKKRPTTPLVLWEKKIWGAVLGHWKTWELRGNNKNRVRIKLPLSVSLRCVCCQEGILWGWKQSKEVNNKISFDAEIRKAIFSQLGFRKTAPGRGKWPQPVFFAGERERVSFKHLPNFRKERHGRPSRALLYLVGTSPGRVRKK